MAVADDNLIIKTFMNAKIENPPYPQEIVDNNGCYHSHEDWMVPVIEKIDCIEGVTLRFYYETSILSIVKYIKDVDGNDIREIDAWGPSQYQVALDFINKLNAL